MLKLSPVGLGDGVSCWDMALGVGFCLGADQKSCDQSVEQHGHYAVHLEGDRNGDESTGHGVLYKGNFWVLTSREDPKELSHLGVQEQGESGIYRSNRETFEGERGCWPQ